MRYVEEFRDPVAAKGVLRAISEVVAEIGATRDDPVHIMEICGGHTHAIFRYGLDRLTPDGIEFIHGPGCPVCVLPMSRIDECVEIAQRPEVIFTTFGDAMRVPGTKKSLMQAKADGADIRMVYSPLDALEIARRNPDREVVFFGLGFETTTPSTALSVQQAARDGIGNFSVFCNHITVPPPIRALLDDPHMILDGFVDNDPTKTFTFRNSAGVTQHVISVPANQLYARFALFDALTDGDDDLGPGQEPEGRGGRREPAAVDDHHVVAGGQGIGASLVERTERRPAGLGSRRCRDHRESVGERLRQRCEIDRRGVRLGGREVDQARLVGEPVGGMPAGGDDAAGRIGLDDEAAARVRSRPEPTQQRRQGRDTGGGPLAGEGDDHWSAPMRTSRNRTRLPRFPVRRPLAMIK